MARYMTAPLDLTIEELNIYQLIYKKADFNSWVSDYTLDQLSTDSHPALQISRKVASRIIGKLITLGYIEVVRVGVKGKATLYKIHKDCIYNDSQRNEYGMNRERIGHELGTNNEPIATSKGEQRNESGMNKERIGNESGHPIIKSKKETEIKKTFTSDSSEYRLSELLFNLMRTNNPTCKEPNLQQWCRHIDLMVRADKRTYEQIETVIKFCQSDSFWKSNILSTSKLREKFDTLTSRMSEKTKPKQQITSQLKGALGSPNPTKRVAEW